MDVLLLISFLQSQTKYLARTTDRLSTLLRQRSDSSSSASSSTSHRQLSPPSIKKDPVLCPSTLDSPPSSSDFCMSVSERVLRGQRKATIKAEREVRNTLEAVPKVKSEPKSRWGLCPSPQYATKVQSICPRDRAPRRPHHARFVIQQVCHSLFQPVVSNVR